VNEPLLLLGMAVVLLLAAVWPRRNDEDRE